MSGSRNGNWKAILAIRLLFLCLIVCVAGLGLAFAVFASALSSGDPGCEPDNCRTELLAAVIVFSLPSVIMLFVGWWRSAASIRRISAEGEDSLGGFRRCILAVLALALLLMVLFPRAVLFIIFVPLVLVTLVGWVIVEIIRIVAKRRAAPAEVT
jgi:hypothetical protein